MHVNVTTNDETGQVAYEVEGQEIKVVTELSESPGEVIVEIWDAAGCSAREARPADQAERVALRTLVQEIRADRQAEVAESHLTLVQ